MNQANRSEGDAPPITRALSQFAIWGALWGMALGFGLLAPGLLVTHRLRPRTLAEWVLLDGFLSLLFAIGGALIAVPAMLAVTDVARLLGRRLRNWSWAVGLSTGPVLILANAVLGELIRRYSSFFQEAGFDRPIVSMPGVAALLAVVICLWLIYRLVAGSKGHPPAQLLMTILIVVSLGAIANLSQLAPLPPTPVSASPLASSANAKDRAPLLMIAIDGGNWPAFDRAMSGGHMPTIQALTARGIRREATASWPPYWSAPAWAAALTGYPREQTGMYEDLSIEAPGLPLFQAPLMMRDWYYPLLGMRSWMIEAGLIRLRVPPREALATPPFWELLALSGRKTAVIRLPYSYPADRQGGALVISDWIGSDWQVMGVDTSGKEPMVAPASEAAGLLRHFTPSPKLTRDMAAELFPEGLPDSSPAARAAIDELKRAFSLDVQTLNAARHVVLAHPGFNVALYLGGWDGANHALWQVRNVAAFSRVQDRYLAFLDRSIQQLVAGFVSAPDVVLLSDHGFADGWHDEHAMFLASGPGVPQPSGSGTMTHFDVVPTLLELQGLIPPAAMPGKSVLSAPGRQRP